LRLALPPAHRLARINYPPRALAFGFTFLVLEALMVERGFSGAMFVFGALQFLVYPHLAYLHARLATDSKRAELHNLLLDSLLLGVWTAQMHFALWPACGLLVATALNNGANGGWRRMVRALLAFLLGAAVWGAVLGFPFEPVTGLLVAGMSFAGIFLYVAWIGLIIFEQNQRLVRTRDALRSSEEQFRFIAEHAGDLVVVLDAKGRLRYVSPSHLDHFEQRRVELGQDWLQLVHPDDRERTRNFVQYMFMSRLQERMALRLVPLEGPSRVVECEGNPVFDRNGEIRMLILVMRDVTTRVRAEIDLRLAAHAFDHLSDAVLVSDGSGRVEYVNRAYCAMIGRDAHELMGRTTNELPEGLQPSSQHEEIWRSVSRTGSWRGRLTERRKDGGFIALSAVVSAVRDKDGAATHFVWVLTDQNRERAASA
jgi:PAS domain S-box-containing protein